MQYIKEIENVLSKGVSLQHYGISNWALTREQALKALEELRKLGAHILGGDVHEKHGNTFKHNYSNWYCNRIVGESSLGFSNRSIDKARHYIEQYTYTCQKKIYFELIVER